MHATRLRCIFSVKNNLILKTYTFCIGFPTIKIDVKKKINKKKNILKTHIDVWDANFSCVKNMFTFITLRWFTEKKIASV